MGDDAMGDPGSEEVEERIKASPGGRLLLRPAADQLRGRVPGQMSVGLGDTCLPQYLLLLLTLISLLLGLPFSSSASISTIV